ncbi:YciI family protein [Herbidospora mongoliensis]|uniref:YciI family protein n=1 Tax=Herbidospora mongoliensis TaxID=688067 RepID=UPI00082D76A7|nr:YciI family protein [Herbidospora mongoliensis]
MRYLITLTRTAQPETPPPAELMSAIMQLGREATESGALVDQSGLLAKTAEVEVVGGKLTVTDGPFAEAKELISYAIYEVRDEAEAIEWANRFMRLHRDMWPGWEGVSQVHPLMTF